MTEQYQEMRNSSVIMNRLKLKSNYNGRQEGTKFPADESAARKNVVSFRNLCGW
jgi:hypothetical protein